MAGVERGGERREKEEGIGEKRKGTWERTLGTTLLLRRKHNRYLR